MVSQKHMSPSTLCGAALFVASLAGVSQVSMLQAGDWVRVSNTARHYFSTYTSTIDWHQDLVE